jgi:Rod binding domain-containing protein
MVPGEAPVGADPDKKLRRACQDFESLFIYKLMEKMQATAPRGGSSNSGQGDILYSICNQQVSIALSKGKGIGIGDMLYKQLSNQHKDKPPAVSAKGAAVGQGEQAGAAEQAGGSRPPVRGGQDGAPEDR